MPDWVDSHCHLQLADADPAELLARAADAGVGWVVVPGVDAESSRAAQHLAATDDRVAWTAGLHPHDAARWPQEADRIAELAAGAAGIGECGLDFYRNLSPPDAQLLAFREQVDLAMSLRKPLVVHCRDAFEGVFAVVEDAAAGESTVLHCWTGGPRWTRRFRDLGVTFSFAGPVAFETGDTVRRGAAEAPPERTLIETDTPYLSPPPYRGEPNEPARVPLVGEALGAVWGMEPAEVARLTSAAAARVFGRA